MKTNEIAFCDVQKSAQGCEKKGDSSEARCNVRTPGLRRTPKTTEGTPRRDEKSAEVIDKQRVEERPSRRRVCNIKKTKGMNEGDRKSKVQR